LCNLFVNNIYAHIGQHLRNLLVNQLIV
jgi:hypothetical protein